MGSVRLPGVRPDRKSGHDVKLSKEAADDFIGASGGTQPIEFRHHAGERLLRVQDGSLRVVLPLCLEALLALHELFSIEVRDRMHK